MQPRSRHSPPRRASASINVTCMPRSAAKKAAAYPPGPAPKTASCVSINPATARRHPTADPCGQQLCTWIGDRVGIVNRPVGAVLDRETTHGEVQRGGSCVPKARKGGRSCVNLLGARIVTAGSRSPPSLKHDGRNDPSPAGGLANPALMLSPSIRGSAARHAACAADPARLALCRVKRPAAGWTGPVGP